MKTREIVREAVSEKKVSIDKNDRNYLTLKLSNGKSILVFHNKVDKKRWEQLMINKAYDLEIEENEKGSWLLVDFYFV